MKIMSLEDLKRKKRTDERMKRQEELTKACQFALDEDGLYEKLNHFSSTDRRGNLYHLISEGVLVNGDGSPFGIMGKNEIKKWYDNLDENISFDINLAHDEDNPIFRQLGVFKKSDLELIENEDGRHSLYVDMKLDEENLIVKELRRKEQLLGLSIGFAANGHFVKFDFNDNDYDLFVYQNIDIKNFGIVVEPQDAKSGNISLTKEDKGEFSVKRADFLNGMKNFFSAAATKDESTELSVEEEKTEEVVEEENSEQTTEESSEETNGQVEVNFKVEVDEELLDTISTGFKKMEELFAAQQKEIDELKEANKTFAAKTDKIESFKISASSDKQKPMSAKTGF